MKNVIVTGANGFVGTAVCKALTEEGYYVTAIVRDEHSDISEISKFPNLEIKYCRLEKIKDLVSKVERKFDVFYHFAWEGSAGDKRGNLDLQLDNVKYTCKAVEVSKELGCRKFVFASSIVEYEIVKIINEEKAPGMNTIYSTAKKTADYMAHAIAGSLEIDYVCGLISNIYGPGEKSPRLINMSIRQLLKGETTAFSPGDQLYDFIYITDAAKMFVAIGEHGKNNKIYYIGSSEPRPLKEYLTCLGNVVAPEKDIGIGQLPFEGVSLSYQEFDIHAVEKDTGIISVISFEEGIKRTTAAIRGELRNEQI